MIVSSLHFLFGPVVAVAALGLICLICRWVFSTDGREQRTARRLVAAQQRADYGLLVPVAQVRTREDAELLRDVLRDGGVRGTVAASADGALAVLVFRADVARARQMVSAG